jgi:hypothetical protein
MHVPRSLLPLASIKRASLAHAQRTRGSSVAPSPLVAPLPSEHLSSRSQVKTSEAACPSVTACCGERGLFTRQVAPLALHGSRPRLCGHTYPVPSSYSVSRLPPVLFTGTRCEVRLCDPCVLVSRVCPGSPRCLFTGTRMNSHHSKAVCSLVHNFPCSKSHRGATGTAGAAHPIR